MGALELGVSIVWPRSRVVCHAEWEAYAATLLLARMEEQALEPAPIWCGDLAELPTAPFLGVDLVCSGFPCQPWSAAGRGQGVEDERWIWDDIARLVRDVGPRMVFLENVSPLISRGGLALVLGDLAALGFHAEWCCLRASDVGAPHKRERVFVLAHAGSPRRPEVPRGAHGDEGQHARRATLNGHVADSDGEVVANGNGNGRTIVGGRGLHDRERAPLRDDTDGRGSKAVVDAEGLGEREPHDEARAEPRERAWPSAGGGRSGPYVAEGPSSGLSGRSGSPERGSFPPGPDGHWSQLPPGAQPSLCRDADGAADWLGTAHASVDDQLRTLGNGVVPAQAAAALVLLATRLEVLAEWECGCNVVEP